VWVFPMGKSTREENFPHIVSEKKVANTKKAQNSPQLIMHPPLGCAE
jgi:hypothetical protein